MGHIIVFFHFKVQSNLTSKGTPLNNSKSPVVESVTGLTMTMIENYMDDHMNDYNSFENMNVTKYFDEN